MTSLDINIADIPSLKGTVAIVTGGASGIGLAVVKILISKGAKAFILDLAYPDDGTPPGATSILCDTTSWAQLQSAFKQVKHVDFVFANAGVSEKNDYLNDQLDASGELLEPNYNIIDVNFRGVLNTVKLARSYMRRQGIGGSIVITSSATAYSAEQSLPLYSATEAALIGLVRALRSSLPRDGITINAVAPAPTMTKMTPRNLTNLLMNAGVPVSSAHTVALAVVYSVVAGQIERVDDYGKDTVGRGAGRWNGRTILTMGLDYTELEEVISRLKMGWFGKKNTNLTRKQQIATDSREPEPAL